MKSKIEQDDDPDQNKKMFQHSLKQQSKAEIHPPLKRLLTETNFASSSTPVENRDRPEKKHRNSENYPRHDCKTEGEYEKEGTGKKSESDQESELKETGYVASRSETEDDDDFNDSTYDDDEEEQDIEGSEDEVKLELVLLRLLCSKIFYLFSYKCKNFDSCSYLIYWINFVELQEDVVELGMLPNRLAIVEMDWRSFKVCEKQMFSNVLIILYSFIKWLYE